MLIDLTKEEIGILKMSLEYGIRRMEEFPSCGKDEYEAKKKRIEPVKMVLQKIREAK